MTPQQTRAVYIIGTITLVFCSLCMIAAAMLTTDAIEHCKSQQTLNNEACYLELTK